MNNLRDAVFCKDVLDCHRCSARAETTYEPVLGEGHSDAVIVFIGRDPGEDEVLQKRPFVGRAGKLLDEMIQYLGLKRQDVAILNAKKCKPPNNRSPEEHELKACRDWLMKELEFFTNKKAIITLGNDAVRSLLGFNHDSVLKNPLKFHKIKTGKFKDVLVIPMFHPAFALRRADWHAWLFNTGLPVIKKTLQEHKVL